MTNEEKARDICRGYNYHGRLTPRGVAGFAVDRCREMAEWKDQQFKKFLKDVAWYPWESFERFMEEYK